MEDIQKFKPEWEQEEKDKELIESMIEKYKEKLLCRESELFHFTSAGLIMNETLDKTLMVYHNIYNSWSWAGGHADGERNLLSVAIREAKEETGISNVQPLSEEPVSIDILTTSSHRKKGKYISSHLHFNISYLLMADEKECIRIKPDENSAVGWIPVEHIEEYVKDKEMLFIYQKLIKKIKTEQFRKRNV